MFSNISGHKLFLLFFNKILKEILDSARSKIWQDSEIPTRINLENSIIFANYFHSSCNVATSQFKFSSVLKYERIILLFIEGFIQTKENYNFVSIPSHIPKAFERCIFP